jgi:hypothetical protein
LGPKATLPAVQPVALRYHMNAMGIIRMSEAGSTRKPNYTDRATAAGRRS